MLKALDSISSTEAKRKRFFVQEHVAFSAGEGPSIITTI
jgi:hypothetical protein